MAIKPSFEGWLFTLCAVDRDLAEERAGIKELELGISRKAAEWETMREWERSKGFDYLEKYGGE